VYEGRVGILIPGGRAAISIGWTAGLGSSERPTGAGLMFRMPAGIPWTATRKLAVAISMENRMM
jgi:hypothetical protein